MPKPLTPGAAHEQPGDSPYPPASNDNLPDENAGLLLEPMDAKPDSVMWAGAPHPAGAAVVARGEGSPPTLELTEDLPESAATGENSRGARFAAASSRFFLGAGLPVFLLAAAALYETFLLTLVFAPLNGGWWGDFAREFRMWCFRYDARTGGMDWTSVGLMLAEPLFIVATAVLLWRRVLAGLRSLAAWLSHWRAAAAGVLAATLASASLFALGRPTAAGTLPPFPGERIRTHLAVPTFRLTDQTGRELGLDELRGRVVLVTGIYAACSTTCPTILVNTHKLLDSLPADVRQHVSVVALSLNPEYETTELMAGLASGYGFKHPEFRYLNGQPERVHEILQQLQFSRVRNPQTGVIEHTNLLLLLDARGEIAYRFTLSARHEAWLREAVLQLVAEAKQQGERTKS